MIFSLTELLTFGMTNSPWKIVSQQESHRYASCNACEVDVGGLEDVLEEPPEEDAVLVKHLFGTLHTMAHIRFILLAFVPGKKL